MKPISSDCQKAAKLALEKGLISEAILILCYELMIVQKEPVTVFNIGGKLLDLGYFVPQNDIRFYLEQMEQQGYITSLPPDEPA